MVDTVEVDPDEEVAIAKLSRHAIEWGRCLIEKAALSPDDFEKEVSERGYGPRIAGKIMDLARYPALSNKTDDLAEVLAGLSPKEREYVKTETKDIFESIFFGNKDKWDRVIFDLSFLPQDHRKKVERMLGNVNQYVEHRLEEKDRRFGEFLQWSRENHRKDR
jgi:hypothetical protein